MTEEKKQTKVLKSLKTRHQNLRLYLTWALDDLKDSINRLEGTLILGGVTHLGLDTANNIAEAAEAVNTSAKRFASLIKREESLSKKIEKREAAQ